LSFSQLLVRLGTLPTCGTSTSHPGSVVGKSRKSFATRHNGPPATLDRFPSTPAGVGVVPTGLPHAATDVPDPFPAVVGQFFRHSPQSSASQPGGHRPGRLPVSSSASRFLPFIDGRCRCVANAGMGRRFCRFPDVGSRLAVVSPGWGSPTGGRPPSSTPVWGPSRRSESPRGCGELFPVPPSGRRRAVSPPSCVRFPIGKEFLKLLRVARRACLSGSEMVRSCEMGLAPGGCHRYTGNPRDSWFRRPGIEAGQPACASR